MKIKLLVLFILLPVIAFAEYGENEVTLSPSDIIEIRFFYTPELNKTQTIRPDGKIVLQLIGEVTAAGKTPSKLTNELYLLYKRYFQQLDIAVFVESYSNRYVLVGGEVNSPGDIPLLRNLSALEAIMLAGGIDSDNATYKNIIVIRQQKGKWVQYRLNLEEILLGQKDEPFYLLPLDIVYVPAILVTPFK